MGIIAEKGIEFYNEVFDGRIYKMGKSIVQEPDLSFITRFKDPNTLDKFIANVDMAINGNFNLINDPDITNDLEIASISPTGIEFYDQDGQNIIGTSPLKDFKEILIGWRDFLLQPPFNGTKVKTFFNF